MAITDLPTDALVGAGLSPTEIDEWRLSAPQEVDSFPAAAESLSAFLGLGSALGQRLPAPAQRSSSSAGRRMGYLRR